MAKKELVKAHAGHLEASIREAIKKAKDAGDSTEVHFEYYDGGSVPWKARVFPNDTPLSLRQRLFK